ncbi:hypothetical protein D9M68_784240 [compost metagenome]
MTSSALPDSATSETGARSLRGSKLRLLASTGAMVLPPMEPSSSVWPFFGALATNSLAMRPPAPARFSTTTVCPRLCCSSLARMRARMSLPPPGAKPTIIFSGCVGQASAAVAVAVAPAKPRAPASRVSVVRAANSRRVGCVVKGESGNRGGHPQTRERKQRF